MRIQFSPSVRRPGDDTELVLSKAGDVLTVNGEAFDFSDLPDGATVPAEAVPCPFIHLPVERISGELRLTLLLPIGTDATEAQRFPAPITVTADGPITLPQ